MVQYSYGDVMWVPSPHPDHSDGRGAQMRHNWTSRAVLALAGGLIAAAAVWAAPAQADSIDNSFLSALDSAGVNFGDPADMVDLGKSVCPMLADSGSTVASTASDISGAVPAGIAKLVTGIAISNYCPEMVSKVASGELQDLPGVSAIPGLAGL
jgi:hypothetical protein